MTTTQNPLAQLAMWGEWQERVKANRHRFAACPIYIEQTSLTEAEFEEAAE